MNVAWTVYSFVANVILLIIVYCSVHRRLNQIEERLRDLERFRGVDFHLEVAKSVEQYKKHQEFWSEAKMKS